MKKAIAIIVLGLFLKGCGTYVTETTSDGKEYKAYKLFKDDPDFNECTYDRDWYYATTGLSRVPTYAIADCYAKLDVYKICLQWDYVYEKWISDIKGQEWTKLHREALSEALLKKNEDPLKCRNPNQDAKVKADYEIKKAKAEARAAEEAASANQQSGYTRCYYKTYKNLTGRWVTRKVCN